MDEPICVSEVGAKLMKKIIVELLTDGRSKTVSVTPADLVAQSEIDKAMRKILRGNGKDETF
jgi:hypothetical protein